MRADCFTEREKIGLKFYGLVDTDQGQAKCLQRSDPLLMLVDMKKPRSVSKVIQKGVSICLWCV